MVCGASAGLGLQLAETLAEQEARVVMVARNPTRLQEAKQSIVQRFPDAKLLTVCGDLTDVTDSAKVATQVRDRTDKVDMVINAVGQSDRGNIAKLDFGRMLELVSINVGSNLNVIQQFAPDLRASSGVLVLIGSLSSHFAPRYMGGYAIAKHGLAALAQQARLELAEDNIHVMLVSPGPIARADSGQRYIGSDQAANLPPEALKSGGGAKIKGLDPIFLSKEILVAAARRKKVLIRPRKARLLLIANALSPALGDYLLRKFTT